MLLWFLFLLGTYCTYAESEEDIVDIESRIFLGRTTTIREYPYFVSVEIRRRFIAEGALLNSNTVLTTAHLTQNKSGLYVRAGTRRFRHEGHKLNVKEIHVHPEFNATTRDYDIAVLKLDGNYNFTSKIKPIEVARAGFEVPAGFYAQAVGWESHRRKSGVLKLLNLQRVPCDIPRRTVTARMHCYSILDSRKRPATDAGGPLILDDKLVGIDSWNYEYKRNMYYTIYVKIAYIKIYEFIEKFI